MIRFAFALPVIVCACSSSTSPTPAPSGEEDAGPSVQEQAAKPINGCSIGFQDQSSASSPRILNWDLPVANSPARCMKIKVGQAVKWQGSFQFHPLSPKDGDTPSPITAFASTTEIERTTAFSTPGTFGFVCDFHPSMTGAIYVVP